MVFNIGIIKLSNPSAPDMEAQYVALLLRFGTTNQSHRKEWQHTPQHEIDRM